MVIRVSSAKEVDALIAELGSPSEVSREAAVARLTVLGARGVARLAALVESDAPAPARIAALRALEAIADPRAIAPAFAALDDRDAAVVTAAIGAVRPFLRGAHGAAPLDRLTAVALDRTRLEIVRTAALDALGDLEPSTLRPLWTALRDDASASIRALARPARTRRTLDPLASLSAAESALGDDASALGRAIVQAGGAAPLATLQRLVDRIRERERTEPPARRADWTRLRGVAHLALARRGSRLALYDVRETLESTRDPLPVEFLAALSLVGDQACLEPLAAAWAHAADEWWRARLADAFRDIVRRERLTRRHAVMKKIEKRWGKAIDAMAKG